MSDIIRPVLDELGVPLMERAEAPAQPDGIPLLANPPRTQVPESWHRVGDTYVVRNVSQPTLTPVLPDPEIATGAAVIVAPGGAFTLLAIGHEGWPIARKLAEQGIAAFVLKYRVNETPEDDAEFHALLRRRMALVISAAEDAALKIEEPRSTEDALAAVSLVRANAVQWGIDPARVGIMGFSAGAIVAVNAAVAEGARERPSFIAPFYPSLEVRVAPPDAPPMFAAVAFDDMYFSRQPLGLIEAWRKAGRPVEFHGFQNGGHGFGLGKPDTTTALVFDQFLLWMRANGLM
jgi:acetyl esterase/lipase